MADPSSTSAAQGSAIDAQFSKTIQDALGSKLVEFKSIDEALEMYRAYKAGGSPAISSRHYNTVLYDTFIHTSHSSSASPAAFVRSMMSSTPLDAKLLEVVEAPSNPCPSDLR